MFHIVLVSPQIPGNTGSVGRTCLALGLKLHLVHPLGFDLSEKALRRAGLDYWKHLKLQEHQDFDSFLQQSKVQNLIFFSRFAQQKVFYEAPYAKDCALIFGSETEGLGTEILEKYADFTYALPQFSPHIRSLNLANTVTAAAYEAYRHLRT